VRPETEMKKLRTAVSVGEPYGHIPGHQYQDVDVEVTRSRRGTWRIEVLETWGSCQGRDEEHGRKRVIGRGETLSDAAADAEAKAEKAEMHKAYTIQAISQAVAEAEDEAEADEGAEAAAENPLAFATIEELQIEIARRQAPKPIQDGVILHAELPKG
jgi:hypothetical protein